MRNKKLNHTPDAIGNCMAYLPQTKQLSHSAQTTIQKLTKPQIDHLRLRTATGLFVSGAMQ